VRAYHLAVPLALLFWQAAPAGAPPHDAPPRAGLFRLGLAYATGEWEDASFDCNGNWTGSVGVPASSAGAKLDYLAGGGTLRVTAVGGRWWSPGNAGDYMAGSRATFAGALVAYEGRGIGLGAGLVSHPFQTDLTSGPSFYLRLGRNDRAHFQTEVFPLTETPTMMGTVRIGVGFAQGPADRPRVNGFVGLAWGPYTDEVGQGVLLADFGFPLSTSMELMVRGSAGPGAGKAQWAMGGGLRASWGR
jgi:hypothetical protein